MWADGASYRPAAEDVQLEDTFASVQNDVIWNVNFLKLWNRAIRPAA